MKKGPHKYGLDEMTCSLIINYWSNGGKYTRDVRDLNEHFMPLVDHTYFKYTKEPGQILVLLPDNPEIKSAEKFTYDKALDAFDIISKGLTQINDLFESILYSQNIVATSFENSLYLNHMGTFEVQQERALGLMINISKIEDSTSGRKVSLDTIEIQQIIPKEKGAGNLAVREMKTDNEVFSNT